MIIDNDLIQKISKKIINYIVEIKNLEKETFTYVKKRLSFIKKFLRLNAKLKNFQPRNFPIYMMIKERNKNFNWSKINHHYDINIDTSDLGLRVSLASLLFDRVNTKKKFLERKYKIKFKKKITLKTQNDIKKFFDKQICYILTL